jgi:hypothetical protein
VNEPTLSPTYLMVAMTHSLPVMWAQLDDILESD